MKLSEFHNTNRRTVAFDQIGDRQHPAVKGIIDEPPELVPDKFGGEGDRCMVLHIRDETGGLRTLYARRQLLTTIGEAVLDSGTDEIDQGGQITVWLAAQKPAAKGGIPQKIYGAHYIPPSSMGQGTLVDRAGKPVVAATNADPHTAEMEDIF